MARDLPRYRNARHRDESRLSRGILCSRSSKHLGVDDLPWRRIHDLLSVVCVARPPLASLPQSVQATFRRQRLRRDVLESAVLVVGRIPDAFPDERTFPVAALVQVRV